MSLHRLTQVAGLTATQTAEIIAGFLEGLEAVTAAPCDPSARVDPEAVRVTDDGCVQVLGGTAGTVTVLELVRHLSGTARGPGAADFDRIVRDAPDLAHVHRAALRLLPDGIRNRARTEIAALVAIIARATSRRAQPETARRPERAGRPERVRMPSARTAEPLAGPAPPPRPARRPPRRWWSVVWKLGAAAVVVALVVALEVRLLGDEIARDVRALQGEREEPAAPVRPDTALPVLGPRAAAPVTGVSARPVRACAPGAPCLVQVTVLVESARTPTPVAWEVLALPRCGGEATVLAAGEGVVTAEEHRYATTVPVTLPDGDALAVGAVSTRPARAASPAFPAPAVALQC